MEGGGGGVSELDATDDKHTEPLQEPAAGFSSKESHIGNGSSLTCGAVT